MVHENSLTGAQIKALMRTHSVTIRQLARSMRITLKRVREVRAKGISGKLWVQDWTEAIQSQPLVHTASITEISRP